MRNLYYYMLITCLFLLGNRNLLAQSTPELIWSKTFTGQYSDICRHLISTDDGGFAMIGESESYGPGIISTLVIKCDALGNIQWQSTYGGQQFDLPMAIAQTSPDNGYILATTSNSFAPPEGMNLRLIKINSNGEEVWSCIVPESNGISIPVNECIVQTEDGGFLVAGSAWKDPNCNQILLFKVDSNGELVWHKEFGSPGDDYGAIIQPTTDGNFILGGYTYGLGSGLCDGYMIKISPEGEEIWNSVVGGASFDSYHYIRQVSDGYIGVGSTQSYGASEQGFVTKVNEDGTLVWSNAFGGNNNEGFEGVIETVNKEYVIVGTTNSYGNGMHDLIIYKISNLGEFVAMETYGGADEDFGTSIQEIPNEGYIVGGTFSETYLDFHAILLECDTLVTNTSNIEGLFGSILSFDGINPNPLIKESKIDFSLQKNSTIQLSVLNIDGSIQEIIYEGNMESGEHSINYNSSLKTGVYLLRIKTPFQSVMKKFIKI